MSNKCRYSRLKKTDKKTKDLSSNYKPSVAYKDKKPTIDEFGLNGIDICGLERRYNAYLKKSEKNEYDSVFVFRSTFIISSWAPVFLFSDIQAYNILSLCFTIVFLVSFIFFVYSLKIKSEVLELKNFKALKNYKKALNDYEIWQVKKQVSFWRNLSGREFEEEVAKLFELKGRKVRICKQGGDEGVDILINDEQGTIAIQCKAHKNKISPSAARDLLGTINHKKISKGMLFTLNGGTSGTIKFCEEHKIDLLDVYAILELQKSIL